MKATFKSFLQEATFTVTHDLREAVSNILGGDSLDSIGIGCVCSAEGNWLSW
jgi:hypothetical protein